jgi:lipopolysaccharide/colanic/teichoic acid biosynthesis glycosyltransferase
LLDEDSSLYVQDYFCEMVCQERRKSERSGKPVLLMLINIEKIEADERKIDAIRKIVSVLFSVTREIDIKGWYKYQSNIGIVFREVKEVTDAVRETLLDKVRDHLNNTLDAEIIKKIRILIHVFPEDCTEKKTRQPEDFKLYPELSKKKDSIKELFFVKRVIDICVSILLIGVLSPFFLIIPLLIKLTSKGPILVRQERIGLLGEKFIFLKFRTMKINNSEEIHKNYVKAFIQGRMPEKDLKRKEAYNVIYKLRDDKRITRLGKILRKTSLDELPQFLNVLKGDMSLVGPRPPLTYEVEEYDIWHRRRFFEVSLWQVSGRSTTTFDEMVRMDLRYANEKSFWLDLKIILKTPWAVVSCRGAY